MCSARSSQLCTAGVEAFSTIPMFGVGERCKHLLFTCTINTEMSVVRTKVFCVLYMIAAEGVRACGPITVITGL